MDMMKKEMLTSVVAYKIAIPFRHQAAEVAMQLSAAGTGEFMERM